MDKTLIARIRSGLATAADITAENAEEVLAVRRDTSVPQSRFFAEKAFGVVKDTRTVLGVPHSTEGVDRMGDIIRLKGWQLDAYKKNPVLLFGHDKGSLPIAKALKVRKGQSAGGMKSLLIDEQFHEADLNPQSELVWRMVESGALPGRSVGFLPLEVHSPETEEEREKLGLGKWGLEFRSQELLESSIVPVPANAEALQGKCYAIAQATAKQAVEDGVATWTDVQRLAGVLPISELDASRIEREQRRSHVAFPEGTLGAEIDNAVIAAGNELNDDVGTNWETSVQATVADYIQRGADAENEELREQIVELTQDTADLMSERAQLRDQVADLTRGIAALARATEARSEDAGQTPERSSNDDAEETLIDAIFRKVEERREAKQFAKELTSSLATRLGTSESSKE